MLWGQIEICLGEAMARVKTGRERRQKEKQKVMMNRIEKEKAAETMKKRYSQRG